MKILGTGSSLPKMQVTNDDLSKFLDTNDEWIFPRTGIKSRHIISSEKLEDLAVDAARKALDDAGVAAGELDMLICSNVVNEFITPSLSCIVASKLGISCPCFDINCACPGFIYAMDMADSYFRCGKVRKVLIVCAEEPTRMIDWSDRSTCVLFGDGAGAAVFGEGDNLLGTRLSAQPDPDKLYEIHKLQPTPYITKEEADVPLVMKGREVFKFAVTTSSRDITDILASTGITPDQVSYYMIHQANLRIIDGIREHLGVAPEKFPTNIRDHGNSSSASCPILLDECNRAGMFKKGDILVFSAFGAGLLSATAVLEW
ncbi:MAG: ketoacyl-ACP synthase III [Bacteroidales bacterium]|nr:ketoacyl-ACP synthase III [Bacteroidales bacterium]